MAQAVWTGQLSFGLVNIPVKLYSATVPKTVRFHQYDAHSGRRIRYRRVVPDAVDTVVDPGVFAPADEGAGSPIEQESALAATTPPTELDSGRDEPGTTTAEPDFRRADSESGDAEVPWERIVKGFEVEPGRVVTVTPEELESVAPEPSRELLVEQFVDLTSIDPVHFDKSYYVVPVRGAGSTRPYWLLYRAMEQAGKVAIGRFVMRTKEYLAAVRPAAHALMLQTLYYADEIRDAKDVWLPPAEDTPERELAMARQLIEALADDWDPTRHRDHYRERVLDLLESKAGEELLQPAPEPEAAPAIDLLESLKASVEAAKQARAVRRSEAG